VRASDVAGVYKLAVISSSGEATDASSLTVVHGWARRDDVRCFHTVLMWFNVFFGMVLIDKHVFSFVFFLKIVYFC